MRNGNNKFEKFKKIFRVRLISNIGHDRARTYHWTEYLVIIYSDILTTNSASTSEAKRNKAIYERAFKMWNAINFLSDGHSSRFPSWNNIFKLIELIKNIHRKKFQGNVDTRVVSTAYCCRYKSKRVFF